MSSMMNVNEYGYDQSRPRERNRETIHDRIDQGKNVRTFLPAMYPPAEPKLFVNVPM